jgi:hypothetical protein
MMYILATTRTGHEFATADAINAMMHRPDQDGDLRPMGAIAVVPRTVIMERKDKADPQSPWITTHKPLLPRLIFIACSEQAWHIMASIAFAVAHDIKPIKRQLNIPKRQWIGHTDKNGVFHGGVQEFFARAEQECLYQAALHEAGRRKRNYRPGDLVRIIGPDLMTGQLGETLGRFIRQSSGKATIETSMVLMGKPVRTDVDMATIVGMSAE